MQGFNGGECGSMALVFRGTRTKTSGCHRQGQAGFDRGATTMTRRWFVLVAAWSRNLDVSFIMFELLCTFAEFLDLVLSQKMQS